MDQHNLETGVEIGDFRIERRIGAGGMGIVYQARQVSLDRTVALKILGAALTRESDRMRFQQGSKTPTFRQQRLTTKMKEFTKHRARRSVNEDRLVRSSVNCAFRLFMLRVRLVPSQTQSDDANAAKSGWFPSGVARSSSMMGFARSIGHLIIERRGRRRSGPGATYCLFARPGAPANPGGPPPF